MKIDLNKGKRWSPKAELGRFYFENAYVQINISNDRVYYKFVGFEQEIENVDEIVSQLSYFTNAEARNIHPSKF